MILKAYNFKIIYFKEEPADGNRTRDLRTTNATPTD